MLGCNNSISILLLAALTACTAEAPSRPDAGSNPDGGVDQADAGMLDAAIPADSGLHVRQLLQRGWFPEGEVGNYVLTPAFDMGLFNLGWTSGGFAGEQVQLTKRVSAKLPGARREWVQIPARTAAPSGVFLAGFAKAPPGRPRMQMWVAQTVTATAPGDGIEVGIHGVDSRGEIRALFLEPDEAGAQVVDGLRWTPYIAEDDVPWLGFITVLAVNRSATKLGFGSPHLGLAAQETGRTRPRLGRSRAPRPAEREVLSDIWTRTQGGPAPVVDEWSLSYPLH